MATSVVFNLIDTLHTLSVAALPSVLVLDGMGVTDDPGDFLMIGVEDPDVDGFSDSAESQHTWAGRGNRARDEVGSVSCCALSWNGDSGDAAQKAARDAAQAIVAAVETLVRTDPNLGAAVAGLQWVRFGERLVLRQIQTDTGAVALVYFQIAFQARL